MIIENLPPDLKEIKSDYCIIGSGAAGITLALELEKKGFDVIILEAGNFHNKSSIASEIVHETGYATEVRKRRFKNFGGSTEGWGGWCTPLDESDFKNGWALGLEELKPFYDRTTEILNLKESFFEHKRFFEKESEAQKLGLTFKHYQFSWPVTRFGQKYKTQIESSNKIKVYLDSPVVKMKMNQANNHVVSLTFQHLKTERSVTAKHFIFCCGSIENARLLMNFSKENKTPVGLGHSHLGKGFMEHPNFSQVGVMLLYKKSPWEQMLGAGSSSENKRDHFFFQINDQTRKDKGWLNLRFKISKNEIPLEHLDERLLSLYSNKLKREFFPPQEIVLSCEQQSIDKNGITLREDKDHLGLSNVNLNWELSDLDWKSYIESMDYFTRKLPALGLGLLRINKAFIEKKIDPFGNSHQMGMTRMGKSAAEGYVDKNLSVFGVDNLSVLGSSVFPSVGAAAPTMTITALSLRLADFLSSKKQS